MEIVMQARQDPFFNPKESKNIIFRRLVSSIHPCRLTWTLLGLVSCLGIGCTPKVSHTPQKSDVCSTKTFERIYFGANTPNGDVTDEQWESYIRDFVTPYFGDGLTVLEGSGQWLGKNGLVVRERSRIIELVHDNSNRTRASIDVIIDTYKRKFQQEAVMDLLTSAVTCFK